MKAIAIILICLAQIAVPAHLIYQYEDILQNGTPYRFEVRPVDPANPFRGRYVRLAFEEENIDDKPLALLGIETLANGSNRAYALLETGPDGLADIIGLSASQPKHHAYLIVNAIVYGQKLYRIDIPFDHYYAEESKAPAIENVVRSQRDTNLVITAEILIRDGKGVIRNLMVGEQSVHEYLNQRPQRPPD